jgi:hypothetical protein
MDKNILIFTGDRNSDGKPADYTGAFLPEALSFMKFHGIPVSNHLRVDLSKTENTRRQRVYDFIKKKHKELEHIDGIAFFCHGLTRKIQLGIRIPDLENFASLIKEVAKPGTKEFVIPLYCCSTGDGPGVGGDSGFADQLRDALCQVGFTQCSILAHSTSGHTTRNPMKRKFDGLDSPVGGSGGISIVSPSSILWKKWRTAISGTDLRFRVPFMTISEIHNELNNK